MRRFFNRKEEMVNVRSVIHQKRVLFTIAILGGVKCEFIAVLICISLMVNGVDIVLHTFWPFVYFLEQCLLK